jgi:hypothetical protein
VFTVCHKHLISSVILSAESQSCCPSKVQISGKWYCSYPELREILLQVEVHIESLRMIDMGLGESIYTKKQLKEFAVFQFSQGTRRAYFAETAELAYNCRMREE